MFKKILLAFAIALIIFGIVIQLQPDTYAVERTVQIKAPPARVFGIVNDFHNFGDWSPWEKLDPNMQKTYSGPPSGTGSSYAWSGNKEAGSGKMTIIESVLNQKVGIHLLFMEPFASDCTTNLLLAPDGDGTRVTWNMTGAKNFMLKGMGLFASMDKMIGPDFERGLAQLKVRAEAPNKL